MLSFSNWLIRMPPIRKPLKTKNNVTPSRLSGVSILNIKEVGEKK